MKLMILTEAGVEFPVLGSDFSTPFFSYHLILGLIQEGRISYSLYVVVLSDMRRYISGVTERPGLITGWYSLLPRALRQFKQNLNLN